MSESYRRNPKVEESPLQGELMLFDAEKSRFFVLNQTMAYLWHNCDGEKSFGHIVESMPVEFSETGSHAVEAEMKAALDNLIKLGLVTAS
jgi:hypothetical protein